MRIGEGVVEEILADGLARVRVDKDSLYVACGACFGAEHVIIMAHNSIGAKQGENVRYEVTEAHLIFGSFLCFILPLIFIGIGAVIAYFLGITYGGSMVHWIMAGALAGLIITFLFWKIADRSIAGMVDARPTISEIIEKMDAEEACCN